MLGFERSRVYSMCSSWQRVDFMMQWQILKSLWSAFMFINHRDLTLFAPLSQALVLAPDKNYLFDLSYLGGLDVLGENAASFLQGQLSCDVRDVSMTRMQSGAMCNLKGRVLALLEVVDWQGLRLIMPTDLRMETQSALSKAAFFSKVTLQPSIDFQCFGFKLNTQQDVMPSQSALPLSLNGITQTDSMCCYHLGNGLYVFLVKQDAVESFCAPFKKERWRGALAWHALQLQAGRLEIYPCTRGMFLPHRLDLQHTSYLSFNKGCYKGQEIIARTHYLAKLKHELKRFVVKCPVTMQSGQAVLHPETQEKIGELVDFCPLDDETVLVALSLLSSHPNTVLLESSMVCLELISP